MTYHEIREHKSKKQNYFIHNRRQDGKWVKDSKFIGTGEISKSKINKLKKEFEEELMTSKKYEYLTKEQVGKIENEARNHAKALKFVKEYKGDLNEAFILKIHSIILKDISERFAGRYRATQVRIFGGDAKFPSSEKVPQRIGNLIYWYKENKKNYHQFELAILISMKFVTIHPFIDGNGRVSRLLMNFLLSKKDYPWINIYNKQRAKYLKAVRKANDEDYSFIFPFAIESLKENLVDLQIIEDL
jgi:Fic family protein